MNDGDFMALALAEAQLAVEHGDVPIGAVVVNAGQVIASAHNEREHRKDPTAHAEILALRTAATSLGTWRLDDATLFVTLEPCTMCAGALVAARVKRLVYGAPDEKAGAAYSVYNVVQDPRLNHRCEVTVDVMREESAALLQMFFREKRI